MEKLTPQEKIWISQLESNNPANILTAIREIEQHGNIRMLPYLFDLMQPSTHEVIRKSIILLVGELKVQAAASLIVNALEHRDLGDDYTPMVAACWHSNLDFSMHIPAFIKIFVEGDYQTAVEAFSVIEESIINAGEDLQKQCIKTLDDEAGRVSEEKYPLFRELVKIVSAEY
ncbi:MAG: hypothetical protein JXK95_16380 [Bacteroidales bacterium]|nr:hypothetical protein [Bacteroidales bacterium]